MRCPGYSPRGSPAATAITAGLAAANESIKFIAQEPGGRKMATKQEHLTAAELERRLDHIARRLPEQTRQETVFRLYAELTTPSSMDSEEARPILKSLNDSNQYFAIRREDLSLVEEVVAMAAGLAGALVQPAALIAPLCVLLLKFRRLRIPLNGEQALVLNAMRKDTKRAWTPRDLASAMQGSCGLDEDNVLRTLVSLTKLRRRGKLVPLVTQEGGHWYVEDI